MAFDAAWQNFQRNGSSGEEDPNQKLKMVLESIKDHPFQKEFPDKAQAVAKFRIRLLNLN